MKSYNKDYSKFWQWLASEWMQVDDDKYLMTSRIHSYVFGEFPHYSYEQVLRIYEIKAFL